MGLLMGMHLYSRNFGDCYLSSFRCYLTEQRIEEIVELSKQPNIVDRLVKSLGEHNHEFRVAFLIRTLELLQLQQSSDMRRSRREFSVCCLGDAESRTRMEIM